MHQPALAGPRPFTSHVTGQALLKNNARLPSRLPLLIILASGDVKKREASVHPHKVIDEVL